MEDDVPLKIKKVPDNGLVFESVEVNRFLFKGTKDVDTDRVLLVGKNLTVVFIVRPNGFC